MLLIWPATVLILAAMFWFPLSSMIGNPDRETNIKLSPAGLQIISKAVSAAAREQEDQGAPISPGAQDRAREAARQTGETYAALQGRAILWIDDHPDNNVHLQNAFAEAGVRMFSALDNEQARELLAQRSFDLAITDVGRDHEGQTAGLALLPLLQAKNIPAIVYSAGWANAHRGQEREYGALQISNDPTEVYSVAIAALSRRR